ncbi:MAG: hypothetical protein ACRC8U_00095 [Brooklawnia sp.]
MPRKIDPELKARAVRLVVEHQQEYPSMNAAAVAVAKNGLIGSQRTADFDGSRCF